jgi:large conductance mechanosensitive channel
MKGVFKEFREFAFKGNMLDLAIGFVLGAAFTAVVNAIAKGILLQIVAAIFGKPDFTSLSFTIHNAKFLVGSVISELINFMIIAAVLFAIVKAVNHMLVKPKPLTPKTTRNCPFCMTEIPLQATRCPACTSTIEPIGDEPAAEPAPAG